MTSVSKNVYIDKLDDIVHDYNNTYNRTIKIKPADVKDNTYIDFKKEVNVKEVKVRDHVKISKYKNKGYTPNSSEEVFVVSKIQFHGHYMLNGKVMIIHLIAGLVKKIWCDSIVRVFKTLVTLQHIKMSKYFPKPCRSFGRNINVKDDLSNYATKTDIKNISEVDTSSFALKTNLANLKTEVDKLDINKLVPVPTDLSKLSYVVKNDVVKKTVYDKLVAKKNAVDTSDFVLKTKYDTDKLELENKISNVTDFVKKAKVTELENKVFILVI